MDLDQSLSVALFPVTWYGGLMDYWRDVLDEYGDLIIIVRYIRLFVGNTVCRRHRYFKASEEQRLNAITDLTSLNFKNYRFKEQKNIPKC